MIWIAGTALLGGAFAAGPSQQGAKLTFESNVLPIFRAHCITCHGKDDPSGDLDLTSADGLRRSKVVNPGHPEDSVLIQRLKGLENRPRMPKGFGPLAPEDLRTIEAWISQGASYAGGKTVHWAYQQPVTPAVPIIKGSKWARNPIDSFVLSRLKIEGLRPSPEATPAALLRRVYLDLIGLPPSPKEIDAFLADRRPDAYERAVDKLLANPHYGEKRAQKWLDLARYADTNGYEKDGIRTAWKFRDWVINAYNANLPYDQFTIKQIAGDLLPNATTDDLIATGFHRNSMFNSEGGVDQEEARYEVINDRVATTATVWLGTSLQCARCHDHKYDPFSQRDYFRMYAFFNNTDYQEVGDRNISEMKYIEPSIAVPSPEQTAHQKSLGSQIAALQKKVSTRTPEIEREEINWIAGLKSPAPWISTTSKVVASGSVQMKAQSDGSWLAAGENPATSTYALNSPLTGTVSTFRLDVIPDPSLVSGGPGRATSGNFILSKVHVWADGKELPIRRAEADFVQQGYAIAGTLDDNPETGWAIAGGYGKPHVAVFHLSKPALGKTLRIELDCSSKTWPQHTLGRFKVSYCSKDSVVPEMVPLALRQVALSDERSVAEQEKLDAYFLSVAPSLEETRFQLASASESLNRLNAEVPTALIMREKPVAGPLKAWLHGRGDFLNKIEEVTAATPTILPPIRTEAKVNRLALARWLVSKDNPLAARVEVNRLWEECFGRGLVETSENFGTQGTRPSHPELLDWLACEFMAKRWDMKALLKLIVMSSTYRQSSNVTAKLLDKDPLNILLARGPRYRLDAEGIRDVALSASGLLDPKIGGPSVFPYQPEGIWDSPYNGERWMSSKESSQYRRGLYTFLKRTAPYPSYMALDATSREQCTIRRTRTNTPLQSLALLNDHAYLEAARALARRVLVDAKPPAQIAYAFELCTGRKPTASELLKISTLKAKLLKKYSADPAAAKKLAGTPVLAAWTMVANVLLNLDETITKG